MDDYESLSLTTGARGYFVSTVGRDNSVHVSDSFGLGHAMRGEDQRSEGIFSYVRLEQRIPVDHPLRTIRDLANSAQHARFAADIAGKLHPLLRAWIAY